jgi:DNA-binding CsgD family transcriptional regulator
VARDPSDETIVRGRLAEIAREELQPKRLMLNDGEAEALSWAAWGKTPAEIAKMLGLAERTVDTRLDNARAKLEMTASADIDA